MRSQSLPCPQLPAAHFSLPSHLSHVYGVMEQLTTWDSVSVCFWRVGSAQQTSIQQNQLHGLDERQPRVWWCMISSFQSETSQWKGALERTESCGGGKLDRLSDGFPALGLKRMVRRQSNHKCCLYSSQLYESLSQQLRYLFQSQAKAKMRFCVPKVTFLGKWLTCLMI